MPKLKDITGLRFNKLLIISFEKLVNHQSFYKCLCDCGNEVILRRNNIVRGHTKSCGCLPTRKSKYIDLEIGTIFNDWTTIDIPFRKNKQMYVKCKCKCGNIKDVYLFSLLSNKSKRCYKCNIRKGKDNNKWNPDLTDIDRILGRNKRNEIPGYRTFRKEVFQRDNYTCQICNKDKTYLNLHHLESYADNRDIVTDMDNGITLCEDCHKKFHSIYGNGKNTNEQYREFVENFNKSSL